MLGFNGRAAVANLNEFPGALGLLNLHRVLPDGQVVGEHEVVSPAVDAGEHGVAAVNLAREQRQVLVVGPGAVQRHAPKGVKVAGHQQLGRDAEPVVGRVSGVVHDAAVVFHEAHEPGVLHPLALKVGHRKQHPVRDVGVQRKRQFVISVGQPEHLVIAAFQGGVGLGGLGFQHHFLQLVVLEPVGELGGHFRHRRRGEPGGEVLRKKRLLVVHRAANRFGLVDVAAGRQQVDVGVLVEHGPAKNDGRNVSLAHRPEADDDALLAHFQLRLVGVFHDGRVEKGRRLDRVFVGEIGAQQQLTVGLDFLKIQAQRRKQLLQPGTMAVEHPGDVAVPLGVFLQNGRDGAEHVFLAQRHHAANDVPGPLLAVEKKAGNDPLHVRVHLNGGSLDG